MFLESGMRAARARVREMMEVFPPAHLANLCAKLPPPPSFSRALRSRKEGELGIIAEIKKRSPSRGDIRPDLKVEETARAYWRAGARAISILTEPRFFGGSLQDLAEAASAVELPVLRKDFIMDRYQLLEARFAGAAAVLLIATALESKIISALLREAADLGLECLVEVHDEEDLDKALQAGADIIGINNRNLVTLQVDLGTTLRLASLVPSSVPLVAESGYRVPEDLAYLPEIGVDAVLVGEALSESEDPERALLAFRGHGK